MGIPDSQSEKQLSPEARAGLVSSGIKILRLASIGRIISIIVHEINNPMQAIQGGSALGLEELDDPKAVKTYLELIQRESARVLKLTGILRSIYGPDQSDREYLSIKTIVEEVMALVKEDIKVKGIILHVTEEENLPLVNISSRQVFVLLLNLFLNVNEAIFSTGHKNLGFKTSSRGGMIILDYSTDFQLVTDMDTAEANHQNFIELSIVDRIFRSMAERSN